MVCSSEKAFLLFCGVGNGVGVCFICLRRPEKAPWYFPSESQARAKIHSRWKEGNIHKLSDSSGVNYWLRIGEGSIVEFTGPIFIFFPFKYSFCREDGEKKKGVVREGSRKRGIRVKGHIKARKIINLAIHFTENLSFESDWADKTLSSLGWGRREEAERNMALPPWELQNLRLSGEKLMRESSEMHDYIL